MSTIDILMNMHPKTRVKLADILLTAALIFEQGRGDWRTYVYLAKNRTVGRLRKILASVEGYTDDQFREFVSKI